MGAFLLIKKDKNQNVESIERLFSESISVFYKKGLSLKKRLVRDDFVIYVFNKYLLDTDNIVELSVDEFIISTGTLIYDDKVGYDALSKLYRDFSADGELIYEVIGNYCIIIYRNGKLFISSDFAGVYHIYCNQSKSVISNSFLAVFKSLSEKTISVQELYEYILNGAFFANNTYIKEIELLDSKNMLQLTPKLETIPKTAKFESFTNNYSIQEYLYMVSEDLMKYFKILKGCFNNNICSALSGGRDSRLMFALMRKVGIKPYLYVYGDESSMDVKIARLIAKGEGINIDVTNKDLFQKYEPIEYREILKKEFYFDDGIGYLGSFDNGADLHTRIDRVKRGQLQLNAGSGEIYRNYWTLPDKSIKVREFLKAKYDLNNYTICTNYFEKEIYFNQLEKKVKFILDINKDKINRQQVEILLPYFHSKYSQGQNCTISNQLSYALLPYFEPRFTMQSFDIPFKYKNYGVFNAELIKLIDPDLAKYTSQYGFNFYDKMNLLKKSKRFLMIHTPIILRPYIRRIRSIIQQRRNVALQYYFDGSYLNKIFNTNELTMLRYININKVKNKYVLSRVLSVELLIKDIL